jgi:transposase-like protein
MNTARAKGAFVPIVGTSTRSERSGRKSGERVAEQEQSGVSVRAYCQQHEIAEHSFYGWRQRLRSDERISFVLVKPEPENAGRPAMELVLATGERLRIPSDQATLGMVLRVLRSRP